MPKYIGLFLAGSVALALAAACGGTTTITRAAADAAVPDDPNADAGTCATPPCDGTPDSGTSFDTPTVCTSTVTWTRGDRGSASMHPGGACINCHDSGRGPAFTIAGTIYPSAHEPDDCNGISGAGTTVVITGSDGKVTNIAVNDVGNFYSAAAIAMPFNAKIVKGGSERAMVATQTVGDCNSCHTVSGTKSAPGRIVAP
jgi:hypothetical protein